MAGTVSRWQLRRSDAGWGGSLEANLGADEQKPDTRPVWWGDPASDGKAQKSYGHHAGKSGSDRGKDQCLTLGDLSVFPVRRSRGPATASDGKGEVSRGHSSPGNRAKGRIRQPRSSLDHSMGVKRQQGGVGPRGASVRSPEGLAAPRRQRGRRNRTRDARGAMNACGMGPGTSLDAGGVEHCRKPPWYVIRMPGGVRGGRREASPYSIFFAATKTSRGYRHSPA